jgi:beta-glucosidase
MQQGVNLHGYYVWSLLDNFEWSHGYSRRFGIVHVDYETQERTVKSSGRYYSNVIKTNGAILEE